MPTSSSSKVHGLYSSKHVGVSTDQFGKPLPFNCTVAPYVDPAKEPKRDCYKGKQVLTHTHLPPFSKLEYAPDAYEPEKKEVEHKLGFASSGALNRDDLSSTLEVERFRHHLKLESRNEAVGITPSEEVLSASARAESVAAATQATRTAHGLASTLPHFTNEYDRQRHVSEFKTRKLDPSVKYERVLGASVPVSYDIGEGASEPAILKSPERGVKKPGTSSIVHQTVALLGPPAMQ